jgi:hypothetical protein
MRPGTGDPSLDFPVRGQMADVVGLDYQSYVDPLVALGCHDVGMGHSLRLDLRDHNSSETFEQLENVVRDIVRGMQQTLAPSGLSERQKKYEAFFQSLLERVKSTHTSITRATKAYPQSWYNFPVGRSGFAIATAFTQDRHFRVELYIDGGDRAKNKAAFDTLGEDREGIEKQLGLTLDWQRLDEKQACRVCYDTNGSIDDDRAHLAHLEDWAVEWIGKFYKVFKPRVRRLKL